MYLLKLNGYYFLIYICIPLVLSEPRPGSSLQEFFLSGLEGGSWFLQSLFWSGPAFLQFKTRSDLSFAPVLRWWGFPDELELPFPVFQYLPLPLEVEPGWVGCLNFELLSEMGRNFKSSPRANDTPYSNVRWFCQRSLHFNVTRSDFPNNISLPIIKS